MGVGRGHDEARQLAADDCKTAKGSRTVTNGRGPADFPTTETIPARAGGDYCPVDPPRGHILSGYFPSSTLAGKCIAVRTVIFRARAIVLPNRTIPEQTHEVVVSAAGTSEQSARINSWRGCNAQVANHTLIDDAHHCTLRASICVQD